MSHGKTECAPQYNNTPKYACTHVFTNVDVFNVSCSIAANISTGEWRLWTKIYWLVGGRTPYVIFNKGVFYTKKKPLQKG